MELIDLYSTWFDNIFWNKEIIIEFLSMGSIAKQCEMEIKLSKYYGMIKNIIGWGTVRYMWDWEFVS